MGIKHLPRFILLGLVMTVDGYPQASTAAENNMFPQWSRDGRKIAFTSDRDGDPLWRSVAVQWLEWT